MCAGGRKASPCASRDALKAEGEVPGATGRTLTEEQLRSIRKILIIQYKPFGDVLLNTAYLPALRKRFPDATIDFLVQRPFRTILADNPNLDNLIIMEKRKHKTPAYYRERIRVIREVRRLGYDMIIDHIRGPGSSQVCLFSGAKYRLGWNKLKPIFAPEKYNWVYNFRETRVKGIYSARAKFRLLKPLGIEETADNTFYGIRPESIEYIDNWLRSTGIEGNELVVFSPASPVNRKQWALELFAETADMIKESNDCTIVLLWGPGELDKAKLMALNMKYKPVIAPETTFNQAGALLRKTRIYIGNDGGIIHLAVSQNTPSIAIFGSKTNPLNWTAWHQPIHRYVKNYDYSGKKDNSFGITPKMVCDKYMELSEYLKKSKGS